MKAEMQEADHIRGSVMAWVKAVAVVVLVFGDMAIARSQSLPGPASGGWYVVMGTFAGEKERKLCFANVVMARFKDGAYLETEAADAAQKEVDKRCAAPNPDTSEEDKAEVAEAQARCKVAQDRAKDAVQAQGSNGKAVSEARQACAFNPFRMLEEVVTKRLAEHQPRCEAAREALEVVRRIGVTKRFGPYPSPERATEELRAAGWKKVPSPPGSPVWYADTGC